MRHLFSLPRYSIIALILLALVYFVQGDRYFGYTSKTPKTPANITSDGTGYFAYLPQFIVYPEKKPFTFIPDVVRKYPDKNFDNSPGFTETNGQITNKFYVGTPLLQTPFYVVAHGIIKLFFSDSDGYSRGYRLAIQIAALFWTLLGCIALIQFLKLYGISYFTATLSTILLALGTNLNTYAVYVPSMSHAYSFAMIALFLYTCIRWTNENSSKQLLYMAVLLGIIAILRPVNLLILLFLPFLFDSINSFLQRTKQLLTGNILLLSGALVISGIIICIQLVVHHDLSGTWSLYTYSGEGFDNWLNPKFLQVLFSSQKGFFLYGPALFLVLPGIYFLFKIKGTYKATGWSVFVLIVLYMISSWWDWTFGGGLGMRPLIEFLPVIILPIAFLIDSLGKRQKYVLYVFIGAAMVQFQFFQYQFNQHILPYSDVTWEQLARIKWKTAGRFDWMFYYDNDKLPAQTKLTRVATSSFGNGWSTKGEILSYNSGPLGQTLSQLKKPICGKLTGEVRLHSDISNPTIYMDYYAQGKKIRSTVQPFGNQVEKLETWTDVTQSYYTADHSFDSVSFRLETFGHMNDYRNLKIDWYILP